MIFPVNGILPPKLTATSFPSPVVRRLESDSVLTLIFSGKAVKRLGLFRFGSLTRGASAWPKLHTLQISMHAHNRAVRRFFILFGCRVKGYCSVLHQFSHLQFHWGRLYKV